jgi:hypothetical protein
VIYRDDAAPVAEKPLITKLDEAASLQVPDPYTTFPMCEILKFLPMRYVGNQY